MTTHNSGLDQRKALSAAEQALRSLADGDAVKARRAAAEAQALDAAGLFGRLVPVVEDAIVELEASGAVTAAQWHRLAEAVGPGPLAALAESYAVEGDAG